MSTINCDSLVAHTQINNTLRHNKTANLQELVDALAVKVDEAENLLKEAELLKKTAQDQLEAASKQAEALKSLKEAVVTVIEDEEDPEIKATMTAHAKRQLQEIISPVKEDDDHKKPKLEFDSWSEYNGRHLDFDKKQVGGSG